MKYLILFIAIVSSLNASCQTNQFIGDWLGKIKISGIELRIALHINEHDNIYITKLDSPDQNTFGISANKTTIIENDSILIDFPLMGAIYNGKFKNDEIHGIFHQNGFDLPLILSRYSGELTTPKRPQIPQAPFPYKEKEVKIKTKNETVKLVGTLTTPFTKGTHPAVILISGSGQQNRDEEIMNHKPFWVLADYLTRNGIAVLRYDDRGVGKSTGDFTKASTFDFADDAEAVFNFLSKQKGVDKSHIGIIGHSEGGLIAPIIATRNSAVKFIVLMAGPSVPGSIIIPDQQELIARASEEDEKDIEKETVLNKQIIEYIVSNSTNPNLTQELALKIERWIRELNITVPKSTTAKTLARQTAYTMTNEWMKTFLLISPQEYLEKVNCPTLALFGEKDLQVSVRANLQPMQQILINGKNNTVHVFPGLNHLFQTAKSGSPSEYQLIEETLSPDFLEFVKNWILQVKN
ncbi:MAG: alpha/beta hydrolase [Crocinitomicaceae bacterium]|nr:alpha/beta hydrolase [Crocinitomicaceae bacterium]